MISPRRLTRRLVAQLAPQLPWRLWRRAVMARLALPGLDARPRRPILFFAPEAGVEFHFATLCVLARTLVERGHEVRFVFCHGLLPHCPVMDMRGLGFEAPRKDLREACLLCADAAFRMLDQYGLARLDLRSFDGPEVRAEVQAAVADPPADLRGFQHDGLAFGKVAALDVALVRKLHDFEHAQGLDRKAWLAYLETAILSYRLMGRLLDAQPASRIIYFNEYSLMLGARLAAQRRGVPIVPVMTAPHCDNDRRRLFVATDLLARAWRRPATQWAAWRELPLTAALVRDVGDDLLSRLRAGGTHSFSSAKTSADGDLRRRLGLDPGRRLIVAYTSSLDELVATRMTLEALGGGFPPTSQLFTDQVEWLRALMGLVQRRDDVQLVVRIHPREGGVKGVRGESQHLALLRAAFAACPPNCRILWPADAVSSYDLGEAASVALVSWSTIGLELARLGVPVLAATRNIATAPADDFVEQPATVEAYFRRLGELLAAPADLGTIARAFRWYHLQHLGSTVDLSDVFLTPGHGRLPPFRTSREAGVIEGVLVRGEDPLAINRARLVAEGEPAAERAALRAQLARVAAFVLHGEDDGRDALDQAAAGPDDVVTWSAAGRRRSRYSPLVARLLRALA